jgi:DNA-binding transcriptional MerR regulator
MSPLLTIGRVAALAEVSPDTIRYYERLGLLPKPLRTPAGYRLYAGAIVHRLDVIRSAQKFGFSLAEIAGFLRVRESGGKPCGEVRAAAGRMLRAVDQQIADLKATRTRMTRTLQAWDEKLTRTPANAPAHLLETLVRSGRAKTGPSTRSALRAGRARARFGSV